MIAQSRREKSATITRNTRKTCQNQGKSAINRPHDVALVQALLGEVKDRGRPLLKDHVSGRFDRETEAALATLFKAAGDRSPNQRLATGHPLLQKIAQNQSLTVLEGTSVPYEARRTVLDW